MAKKPIKTRAPKGRGTTNLPDTIKVGGELIKPTQVFMDNGHKPASPGPWSHEPDKLSWTDPATGLQCTILRMRDGALSGAVAVSPEHPLFGFEHDAIPADISVEAHGGLSSSGSCDDRGAPSTTVCPGHDPERRRSVRRDDEWWFSFRCNHKTDFVPRNDRGFLRDEDGRTYRDASFAYRECTKLASQLAAISADGGATGQPDRLTDPWNRECRPDEGSVA